MKNENTVNLDRHKHSLKSVILESRKIREDRGEDFFDNKKNTNSEIETSENTSKIHLLESANANIYKAEKNFKTVHESHHKLREFIDEYDKKIFDQNSPVLNKKKPRSKSIHLYVDENIEHFLNTESKKAESQWGLRKNAGLGQLIQKFILNFMEIKKREERQLKRVKKVIEDFRACLVDFKKYSAKTEEFQKAEVVNQKMKTLSNDLRILLSLLEFEDSELKICLGNEVYQWINFIVQWKYSQD